MAANYYSGTIHRDAAVRALIKRALAEDIGAGDVTTEAVIPERLRIHAEIRVKESNALICGLPLIPVVVRYLDPQARVRLLVKEGSRLRKPCVVAALAGQARAILQAERTLLNITARLSGIATITRRFADLSGNTRAKIYDTRKTTPGLRILEKYAVRIGGGRNHRCGLFDQILIKDNHRHIIHQLTGTKRLDILITAARLRSKPRTIIEIEVETLAGVEQALRAGPDIIMLDNMTPQQMRRAVRLRQRLNRRVKLEASGNIDERNVGAVARTGVDIISVGKLTHSARSIDMNLTVTGLA